LKNTGISVPIPCGCGINSVLATTLDKKLCVEFKDCLTEAKETKADESNSDDEGECTNCPQRYTSVVSAPFFEKNVPEGVRDIDLYDINDSQCCTEYVLEMFENLFVKEKEIHQERKKPAPWDPRHRRILIDWLVDVCLKFQITAETFLLAVEIMDYAVRQPEFSDITPGKIHLLGCTSLWMASKLEECYHVEARDMVYICDRAYKVQEILKMEVRILNATKLRLLLPHSILFLRRFSKAALNDATTHTLAKYICESVAVSHEICDSLMPSEIAAGAVYLAGITTRPDFVWDETLSFYTRIPRTSARGFAQHIYNFFQTTTTLKACRRKYSTTKLLEVGRIELKNPN